MPAPPDTPRKKSDPTRQDEAVRDVSAEVERLVTERLQELQIENKALRREVARLQHTETILRESEEKYRLIADFTYDWEEWTDPRGSYVYVSPSSERITGYSAADLTADPMIQRIIHPEDWNAWKEHVKEFHSNRTDPGNIDFRVVTKSGDIRWISHYCQPVYSTDGVFLGRRGSNREITERKQAEGALETAYAELDDRVRERTAELSSVNTQLHVEIEERKRAEEALRSTSDYLESLINYANAPIIVWDSDQTITRFNNAFERLTEYTAGEVIGQKLDLLFPEDTRDESIAKIQRSQTEHWESIEIPILRKDGDIRIALWNSANMYDEKGDLLATIAQGQDITKRKQAEKALQRHTDELIRLNRKLDEAHREANMYLDIMTHDVRNANNVSGMYADLLVELLAGDQWLYARKLRDSIGRSSEILRNVATIRRLQQESNSPIPVNLDVVIKEEIGNFPGVSIQYDSRRVDVLADGLLPVIFTNLLGNAVKFGGPDVEIAIRVEEPDGKVLISVEDTGPGVPDEMKEKLFHRFERGVRQGKGEGLGLYICRTLVKRYGGRIWVEDRVPGFPEGGAAFWFTLRKAE